VSALIFLGVAVVVSLVGIAIMALRARQPTSLESGIDAFKREMQALEPEDERRQRHAGRDPRRR
jgi:hypothetical protein